MTDDDEKLSKRSFIPIKKNGKVINYISTPQEDEGEIRVCLAVGPIPDWLK